jgi:hypothetical protein
MATHSSHMNHTPTTCTPLPHRYTPHATTHHYPRTLGPAASRLQVRLPKADSIRSRVSAGWDACHVPAVGMVRCCCCDAALGKSTARMHWQRAGSALATHWQRTGNALATRRAELAKRSLGRRTQRTQDTHTHTHAGGRGEHTQRGRSPPPCSAATSRVMVGGRRRNTLQPHAFDTESDTLQPHEPHAYHLHAPPP